MKKFLCWFFCLIPAVLLSACGSPQAKIEAHWEKAARICLSESDSAAREDALIRAELGVERTQQMVPGYLTSGSDFRAFLSSGKGSQEVFDLSEDGILTDRLFVFQRDALWVYTLSRSLDGSEAPVETGFPIQDFVVTDRGNFYYRVLPAGDKHYADYTLIRLEQPQRPLWELTEKYLSPGTYMGANLFLTDWSEGDWQALCFNDLWESLFYSVYGEIATPEWYFGDASQQRYQIPAGEFEAVILRYFHIDQASLRSLAQYDPDTDSYPWRPLISDYFVDQLYYYRIQPEVTAFQENEDGTLTLTVDALCTDLAQDRLFSHQLTVRPLGNSGFQYVSNQVTYQTEAGLPDCQPRLTWKNP